MSAYGIPEEDIAKVIGVAPKTLRKHFRVELDTGLAKANASIADSLFQSAKKGNVTAQIFWLKCRARWVAPKHVSLDVNEGLGDALSRILKN